MAKKIAIYPGTFDPVTYGHIDVIERASVIFDSVIVAVSKTSTKKTLFTVEERVSMLKKTLGRIKNLTIDSFDGLLVDYARSKKASVIIRGLRAVSDFEYEFQMALTNRKLQDNITTVFLMPHEKYSYLNSSLVREIAACGGDVSPFVPPVVAAHLSRKFR